MATNLSAACSSVQPYAVQGGPVNTCAYRVNATADALGLTAKCCGEGNDPVYYNPPGAPANCFKICNILNYTSDNLQGNSRTLSTCLDQAMGEHGNVYCDFNSVKPSAAGSMHQSRASWSAIGIMGILVGTTALTL